MAYEPLLAQRIFGSLAKHVNTLATSLGVKFYAEGVDDESSEVYQNTNLSLRVDGPRTIEGSSVSWNSVDVQVMVTCIGGEPYLPWQLAGAVADSIRGVIPLYNIPSNDPLVQVGCLDIDPSLADSVRLVNLSRVSTSSNVRQIAVVTRLRIDLDY